MKKKLLFLLTFLYLNVSTFAEGTKEVSPSENNLTGLAAITTTGAGSYFGCPEDNRIYFNIKDFNTERFYFGVRPHYYNTITGKTGTTWCADSIYVRIFNPSNAIVFQQKLDTTAGNAGFINTYAQAIAGPNVGGFSGGYNPLTITPLMNGDYWMEFYYSNDGGATMIANATSTNTAGWLKFPYFDFTVATASNTRFTGRVHSDKWNFVAITNAAAQANGGAYQATNRFEPSGTASSDAAYFSYSPDSVVMKIDFEPGFRPIAYNIAVNNYGVANNGNWLVDRRSVNSATAPSLANGYKIFLNDPDATIYPSGFVPGSASFPEPTVKGCPPTGPYKLRYKIPAPADVIILLDINGTSGYQPATTDRLIEQPARAGGLNTYTWDGKDGLGNQLASGTVLNFSVSTYFQKGKASVPLYDAEINKNGFKMSGIRPVATTALRMFWDDSQLTNVGACGTTPGNTSQQSNLTGLGIDNSLFGTAAPSHAWNGTGNLSNVVPAPNSVLCSSPLVNDSIHPTQYQWDDFGNVRVINTWAYGIESFITKSIKLLCVNVSGTVINDVDGSAAGTFSGIQNGSETGNNGGTLYAAVVDPETNEVIAFAIVGANGTYTINGVPVNSTGLKVIITSVLPVIDMTAPAGSGPSGWGTTTPNTATINTLEVNIVNVNYGINQLPESAVNSQTGLLNPGGTANYSIPSSSFVTSNVGANPNTSDFGGGTVASIRITSFPANATSITINGVKYGTCGTCTAWPAGGVVTPFTPGSGPTTPILVDPINGFVNVVIPFVAIDNAGGEDPTPGSVTLDFSITLSVKYVSFTANKVGSTSVLNFEIAESVNGSIFNIERSEDGRIFKSIVSILSSSNTSFNYTDFAPITNSKNYYRIKEIETSGRISYSEIRIVKFTKDNKIEIYPVPVKENLNIVFGDNMLNKTITILLYNAQGQQVLSKQIGNVKSTETIALDNILPGVYQLRIVNNNEVVEDRKVIKIN